MNCTKTLWFNEFFEWLLNGCWCYDLRVITLPDEILSKTSSMLSE